MDIENNIITHILIKNYYCVMLFVFKIEFNLKKFNIYKVQNFIFYIKY